MSMCRYPCSGFTTLDCGFTALNCGFTTLNCGCTTSKRNYHQKISVANMIELLLKSFWCIAHLYLKPGRFPKGWLRCRVTSRRTWRRIRLP